jgi:uncharacterized protein (TIGR00369 family)
VTLTPDDFPVPTGCFIDVLDLRLAEVAPGSARALMRIGKHHLNQAGAAQAGCLVGFADAVAGWATKAAVRESGSMFSTLELNANVLRPAREGDELEAVATTDHQGRSTAVVRVDVRFAGGPEGPGRLVASFRCTQMITPPKADARGTAR